MDCIERANLMKEIEGYHRLIKYWLKIEDFKIWMHFARYRVDNEEDDEGDVDVEGRVRVIQQKMGKMEDRSKARLNEYTAKQQKQSSTFKTKMNALLM